MKSLAQHNKEREIFHRQSQINANAKRNGIACPKCKSELWDTHPNIYLTSDPPQKNVHCQCGFTGLRIA